jgi:uncharacterized hydrophobic protein (TIGR00271 family)
VIHLRIVTPEDLTDEVLDLLRRSGSTVNILAYRGVAIEPAGDMVSCDVADEDASYVVADLRALGVSERGSIDIDRLDASVSRSAREAEARTPGSTGDAVLWENVGAKVADQGFLSWGQIALFGLSGIIASVGILIDSAPIVVGAMAVSPDFGPVAAFAVGIVRGRVDWAIRAFLALVAGFTVAIGLAFLGTVVLKVLGIAPDEFVRAGNAMATAISAPDGFSAVVALCAGIAGMLSVTLGRSAALVGVAISITTIPAAADIGLSTAYADWTAVRGAALQLGLNIGVLLVAAAATLAVQRAIYVRRRRRHRLALGLRPLRGLAREPSDGDVTSARGVSAPSPGTPTPPASRERERPPHP